MWKRRWGCTYDLVGDVTNWGPIDIDPIHIAVNQYNQFKDDFQNNPAKIAADIFKDGSVLGVPVVPSTYVIPERVKDYLIDKAVSTISGEGSELTTLGLSTGETASVGASIETELTVLGINGGNIVGAAAPVSSSFGSVASGIESAGSLGELIGAVKPLWVPAAVAVATWDLFAYGYGLAKCW